MDHFLEQAGAFFSSISTEIELLLAILGLLLFTVGLVTGWLLQHSKTRFFAGRNEQLEGEHVHFRSRIVRMEEKIREQRKQLDTYATAHEEETIALGEDAGAEEGISMELPIRPGKEPAAIELPLPEPLSSPEDPAPAPPQKKTIEQLEHRLEQLENRLSGVAAAPASPAPDPAGDDLTRIRRIGPFLQGQLNKAGVHRYAQIADWSTADIDTYTELIGYLPGVIERDGWVEQARLAAAGKFGELAAWQARAKGEN